MEKQFKPVPDVECLKYHGTPEKPDIKIFVSHRIDQDSETIDNPLYIPVRCGAVYDDREGITMLGDDTGDNISEKRMSYCELTVQYWAWKNVKADYYGLCHYRRYLSFAKSKFAEDIWGNVNYDYIGVPEIRELNLYENAMRSLIQDYDMIVSEPYRAPKSVYEQYKSVPSLHVADLDRCLEVIDEIYPQYSEAAQKYVHGKLLYPCCMFIMRKEIFFAYSEWTFNILKRFEETADFSHYGTEAYRTIGHLGERLLGIYFTYIKEHSEYKTKTLQRAIFWRPERQRLPVPAFENNSIPVVLTSSDYFVPYAAATLMSIVKNSAQNRNYDVVFLYTDISEKSKALLQKTIHGYPNFSIQFVCVSPFLRSYNFTANNHITIETFYRLFVQRIFKNYEKVLYLDCDLIVKEDIARLYDIDIGENLIGATLDADWLSQYNGAIPAVKPYCKKVLKLKNPYTYFQAGVLLFNIKEMNRIFELDELASYACTEKFMYLDQDVLNSKCQGRVCILDLKWNVMTSCGGQRKKNIETFAPRDIAQQYAEARKKPSIIHYAGYLKPWDDPTEDFAGEFWENVRGTFLYEILLSRMGAAVSWNTAASYTSHLKGSKSAKGIKAQIKEGIKRISFVFLPAGSARRQKVKLLYLKIRGQA